MERGSRGPIGRCDDVSVGWKRTRTMGGSLEGESGRVFLPMRGFLDESVPVNRSSSCLGVVRVGQMAQTENRGGERKGASGLGGCGGAVCGE